MVRVGATHRIDVEYPCAPPQIGYALASMSRASAVGSRSLFPTRGPPLILSAGANRATAVRRTGSQRRCHSRLVGHPPSDNRPRSLIQPAVDR